MYPAAGLRPLNLCSKLVGKFSTVKFRQNKRGGSHHETIRSGAKSRHHLFLAGALAVYQHCRSQFHHPGRPRGGCGGADCTDLHGGILEDDWSYLRQNQHRILRCVPGVFHS